MVNMLLPGCRFSPPVCCYQHLEEGCAELLPGAYLMSKQDGRKEQKQSAGRGGDVAILLMFV